MDMDKLGNMRQARGYSLDMMAGWLGCSLEEYLELEFCLRLPEKAEQQVMEKLFCEGIVTC